MMRWTLARSIAAILIATVLTGCQDAFTVVFHNQCKSEIQIRPTGTGRSFKTVPAGENSETFLYSIDQTTHEIVLLTEGAADEVVVEFDIDELEDRDGNSGTFAISGSDCG